MTERLCDGEILVIAGPPGAGKSTAAQARSFADGGFPVVVDAVLGDSSPHEMSA